MSPEQRLQESHDHFLKGAVRHITFTGSVVALGIYMAGVVSAGSISQEANEQGRQAASVSGHPFRDMPTGECLVIPDGHVISNEARAHDDACIRGREAADAAKANGLKYAGYAVGATAVLDGIAFVALRRNRKKTNTKLDD